MKKIKLEITNLSYSQTQSKAYALVLSESEGTRRLPIIIGNFEAQVIAIELEKMTPSRPLTHDLFQSFASLVNANIKEVIITNLLEGVFFSKIVIDYQDMTFEIDARTSDAIAIAMRAKAPIYVFENILDMAGIELNDDLIPMEVQTDEPTPDNSNPLHSYTLKELEAKMEEAIRVEDYEVASQIRDEINRRQE